MTDHTELRRLLAAVTPRPWMVDVEGDEVVVIVDEGDEFSFTQIAADLHQGDDGHTDARLIVAAVNALPDLLDALDAAELAAADAILHESDARDALARQTPLYLAAEAALARVRETVEHYDGLPYAGGAAAILRALDGEADHE